MGSQAYGVASAISDMDIYGFSIPKQEMLFPHLRGEIQGFGRQIQRFEQYQCHHVEDKEAKKEYDFSIYNIVKYFQLVMDNNPNIIDSLFVPRSCILFTTKIGEMVRENRKLFLHKGSWHKFKSYSYSQLHKIRTKYKVARDLYEIEKELNIKKRWTFDEVNSILKNNGEIENLPEYLADRYKNSLEIFEQNYTKRWDDTRKYGHDLKFSYHCIRLLGEVEQILTEGDLDLQRNREQLKSIRRGEWKLEDVIKYFETKERELESLYLTSKLQHSPDEGKIKQLLIDCLEEFFGDLSSAIVIPNRTENLISDLEKLIERYRWNKI